ncbi:MAG: manganese efflux pump [Ruminococcaceae bacterium]|nr:manganese efflux pump [Oscillospiraceae bacterium]
MFIFNSILLGVGLAMDAFSVSVANGMNEPRMRCPRMCAIAGTFGGFQFLMPMLGWYCVRAFLRAFSAFEPYIPWIALALLSYIGVKMIYEALEHKTDDEKPAVTAADLLVQGVATSIDALSVGFTIAEYDLFRAVTASLLIGVVTFAVCMAGLRLGRSAGMKLADKAGILGGVILILIGLEIFITGRM